MTDCTALSRRDGTFLVAPEVDLGILPVRLSKRLWVTPTEFLQTTNALATAAWALRISQAFTHRLVDPSRRGPKIRYGDSSMLIMAFFRAHPEAALSAGFADGRVVSIGQYWERRQALGIWPFWFFFLGMVWQLIHMKIIYGVDVILDSTTQHAWYHDDEEAAWSFPKPWKGSTWGYKVHTLLCRWSELPIMFLVTPANRHDSPLAMPLLSLAVAFFGFPIAIVRADAAYFSFPLLHYIHSVLRAGFVIDYNLRRHGKKALATLPFLRQWRFHLKFRAVIERHFAWAKRYFGLEAARWKGLTAAYQHTALVYSVMLGVALTAHRFQRPDLAGSRMKVLAIHVPA